MEEGCRARSTPVACPGQADRWEISLQLLTDILHNHSKTYTAAFLVGGACVVPTHGGIPRDQVPRIWRMPTSPHVQPPDESASEHRLHQLADRDGFTHCCNNGGDSGKNSRTRDCQCQAKSWDSRVPNVEQDSIRMLVIVFHRENINLP